MEYSLLFDYGCEDKTTLTIKAAGSQEVTVTYRNGNVVIQSDTAFTLRQFAPAATKRSGSTISRQAARSSRPPRSRALPGNKEKDAGLAAPPAGPAFVIVFFACIAGRSVLHCSCILME